MSGHAAFRQLDDFELRLDDLERRRLLMLHDRLLGGPTGDPAALDEEEAALLRDPGYAALLDSAPPTDPGHPRDARRLDRHRARRPAALVRTDPEVAGLVRSLHGRILDFRPYVNEAPAAWVDVRDTLRTEPDASRREALWFAAVPLAESIESDVQRLFALRNRLAEEQGFASFPELVMAGDEFSVLEFLSLCDELEQETREPWEELLDALRRRKGTTTIEPWDLDVLCAPFDPPAAEHPAAQFAPRLDAVLAEWGLARAGSSIRVTEATLPYGGLTLPVSIPDDIRVLVQPRDGLVHLEAWFHEMGHALHLAHPGEDVSLHRDAPAWEEAMAFLLERAGVERALRGATPPADRDVSPLLARGARSLLRMRRLLAESLFEILAYERPGGDLHGLYSEIHEHYLGFPRHPERLWPARALFVTHPVYLPNYVLGRLMAAQLEEGRREPAAWGARIRDAFWRPGAARPWTERVESLTGRPLDPDAWLRDFRAPVA